MKIKGKNAISLIVLVITILVLSILAATVIISISNTNIISEASKTTFKSDMSSYKEAYEMYVANELAKNAEFDRTTLNITQKDTEFSDIFGDVESRYKEGLKVVAGKLVYESSDEAESEVLEAIGMKLEYIDKDTSYVGYYADIDGDGTVDGVIFADLCIQSYGEVSQVSESTVKDYYISQSNFSGPYEAHPVLTVTGSGADRFYVMSLNRVCGGYFYKNAGGSWIGNYDSYTGIPESIDNMYILGANGSASFNMSPICSNAFGAGPTNTANFQSLWSVGAFGAKDSDDIWQNFTYKNPQSGFIPSYDEWVVFADVIDPYCSGWISQAIGEMSEVFYRSESVW